MPRVRKSPFYESALRAGAKGVTVYNHMLMRTYYETPEVDYWKLMTNVTLWDVGCERQVEITGLDAFNSNLPSTTSSTDLRRSMRVV